MLVSHVADVDADAESVFNDDEQWGRFLNKRNNEVSSKKADDHNK